MMKTMQQEVQSPEQVPWRFVWNENPVYKGNPRKGRRELFGGGDLSLHAEKV